MAALVVSGLLCLVVALSVAPYVWATLTGHANTGYTYLWAGSLPKWTTWHELTLAGVPILVVGLTSGVLIVLGRTFGKAAVVAGLVYTLAATRPFASGGYWVSWMATRGDAVPLAVQVDGFFCVFVLLGVAAIWTAVRR